MRLEGRKALVTGASRGIGEVIALTFAREGADVSVNYLKNRDRALEVVEAIRSLGRDAIAVQADVSVKSEVEKMIEDTVNHFGRIDILVNNAVQYRRGTLLELSEEDWDVVLDIALKGVFLCAQAAAKHMVKNRYGKIINIASMSGLGSITSYVNYSSAKAGVIAFTKTAAFELGKYGIYVNAISPGTVEPASGNQSPMSILGRFAKPQEIANIALFLASDESSVITAENIRADGGSYRHI